MIKAVILDFGGVVFRNKETYDGPQGNLQVDPEMWHQAGLGLVEDEVVFAQMAKNHEVSPEEIKRWLFSKREPNQELLDLLSNLKPGVKTAVLNNGLKTLFREFIAKYELEDKFEVLMNSAEEGVKKPDQEIYLRVCKKLGVEPENCLLVDDDQANINGSKTLGMEAILFTGVPELEARFRELQLTG